MKMIANPRHNNWAVILLTLATFVSLALAVYPAGVSAQTFIALNDTFDVPAGGSATRLDEWDDWYDTDWWIVDTSQNPVYQVQTGSGNGLVITDSKSPLAGVFNEVNLQNVGDYIQLDADYRWSTSNPQGNSAFKIGLYHNNDDAQALSVVLDDNESTKTDNDLGYFLQINPLGFSSIVRDDQPSLLSSTNTLDAANPGPANTAPHHLELKLEKTPTGYGVSASVDGSSILSGSDSSPLVGRFNEVALRQSNLIDDIVLDNIQVSTNVTPYGKAFIESHDFTRGGVYQPVHPSFHAALIDANLNAHQSTSTSTVIAAQAAGVDMSHAFLDYELFTFNDLTAAVQNFEAVAPGVNAYMVSDEPSRHSTDERKDFDDIGQRINWIKGQLPDKLVYSNAFNGLGTSSEYYGSSNPGYSYEDYLSDFVKVIRPDVMSWDHAPFRVTRELEPTWFSDLMAVREVAQRNLIPYIAYTQGFVTSTVREASESDMRMNVFSLLAAGYKGYQYYIFLDQFGLDPGEVKYGLINSNAADANDTANFSAMYGHAQSLNEEVEKLGPYLKFMESTDVRYIPGGTGATPNNPTPNGITNWSSGAGDLNQILNVTVDLSDTANRGARKDGMIGFFDDPNGDIYFMLTNVYHGALLSANDASLTFVIDFDQSVDQLIEISRLDGSEMLVPLTNNTLTVNLPGGTGNLYRLLESIAGDFNFDGIVDGVDFLEWQRGFGTIYDSTDLANWTANYGTVAPLAVVSAAVPEPTTCILLMLGTAAMLFCRDVVVS